MTRQVQQVQEQDHDHAARCAVLFAAGAFEDVRRTAGSGLAERGPDPVLYRWLGLAHAAEDEREGGHDAEAELAYRKGLELAADDPGLLVSYLRLCLRADPVDHPGRAARATALECRIAKVVPKGSPERDRVDEVLRFGGRDYWEDPVPAGTPAVPAPGGEVPAVPASGAGVPAAETTEAVRVAEAPEAAEWAESAEAREAAESAEAPEAPEAAAATAAGEAAGVPVSPGSGPRERWWRRFRRGRRTRHP
ncbi:hypothetical protein [Streptomyces sp. NPDC101132]|uniref:hypothetical protein n=1 Tax=Streptomyces sp. NPDC101132 TaxID=3366110 RepID=UPI003816836D